VSCTLTKKLDTLGGPGEIKKSDLVFDPQVSPEEIKSREVELGLKVGLLLLQLFPNGGTTDIVFVTVPHSSRNGNYPVVLAAVHGSLGLPGGRLSSLFSPPLPPPPRPRP